MAMPRKTHTIESLLANTEEVGDCHLWRGYSCNGVPQIFDQGRMVAVRKVIHCLMGHNAQKTGAYRARCNDPACIAPDHVTWIADSAHMKIMQRRANSIGPAALALKKARISKAKTGKFTPEQIGDMRLSTDSIDAISQRVGASRSTVKAYRSGKRGSTLNTNPFAGLMPD